MPLGRFLAGPPGRPYPAAPMWAPLPIRTLEPPTGSARGAVIRGLTGGAAPALLAPLLNQSPGATLWVTEDGPAAERAADELRAHLGALGSHRDVLLFPAWDGAPYRGLSPAASVRAARLHALFRLGPGRGTSPPVVVGDASALLKLLVTPARLARRAHALHVGASLDRERLLQDLVDGHWLRTDRVSEPGSFAVRGGILDLFPPTAAEPVRVELWGDEIDSLRRFDPWTQRSLGKVARVDLVPVREEWLDAADRAALPGRLKALADVRGLPLHKRIKVQSELLQGTLVQEVELYLPLLTEELSTIFDHLGPTPTLVWDGPGAIEAALWGWDTRLRTLWEREDGHGRLVPEPQALFIGQDELASHAAAAVDGGGRVFVLSDIDARPATHTERLMAALPVAEVRTAAPGDLRPQLAAARSREEGMLEPFAERARSWLDDGFTVAVASGSAKARRFLLDALRSRRIPAREVAALPVAPPAPGAVLLVPLTLERGYRFPDQGLVVLSGAELALKERRSGHGPRFAGGEAIGSLDRLEDGGFVVHALHGVGQYRGLQKLAISPSAYDAWMETVRRARADDYKPGSAPAAAKGSQNDYLVVEYRDGDRLYLPVHKLDQITRYVGAGGPEPSLDKLGGQTFAKKKKKVHEEVQKVAKDLLDLYARRQVASAAPVSAEDPLYGEMVSRFPYEETPDQQSAIDAVLADLGRDKPMDRLLCGDVGFGKTEVALRATFRAVLAGRQVAFLAPTTILALQHWEKARQRFDGLPVVVEMLSRLRSAAEQKDILQRLERGAVDVVVGTHRLLGEDVRWKDLGLLVVDEEHRFGVTHKERMKKLRSSLHVLSMSATPIPRTLHMAMSGLRDFSVIHTPPAGRKPVNTQVVRFSPGRVQDAIQHELARGGQVFFVHNRVQTIERMAAFIRKLVPGETVGVGHGQMKEQELEALMVAFEERRFRVLVCTTIVESGIDIPTANTMLIHRADTLGLAQLHQLRGRVGRSHARGHCLLLVPPGRALRKDAVARLKAIQDHNELGSGALIAQQDLEIRGAGNLLGHKQSGPIGEIGLAAYTELLETAIRGLRGERVREGFDPDIDLKAEAYLPAHWVPDERERLLEYKSLADCADVEACEARLADLADRYGPAPPEALRFVSLVELKAWCRTLRIRAVRPARGARVEFRFDPTTPVHAALLANWVGKEPRLRSLTPEGVVIVSLTEDQQRDVVAAARGIVEAWAELRKA